MLGLVIIYWVGKSFHSLAGAYKRNQWLWAIIGIVIYIATQLMLGVAYGIMYMDNIEELENETLLNIGGAIASGLVTWATYQFLKSKWSRVNTNINPTMLDDDLLA